MIISMKCTNEEYMVDKVIGDIHNESWVEKIIVIDGGSTDLTIHELKKYSKCQVYIHPWLRDYHDMETSQSNIQMSYIPMGQIYFILDFDERCSPELKNLLAEIDVDGMPDDVDCICVSRRSYELMRFEESPFAIPDDKTWWVLGPQIGQYPDFQMRIIRRKLGMHWINSPHHVLFGTGIGKLFSQKNIQADLIHYHGREDARSRERTEKLWLRMQARRKELDLSADVFETHVSPEMHKYATPEYWQKD